jgi:hypothetical protein
MTELLDTFPDINVHPAEYKRLLGYPPEATLSGRARELADWARNWYAKNGQPWVYVRPADSLQIRDGHIVIDDISFASSRLGKTLNEADAHSIMLAAISAGSELEHEAQKLWKEDKPDEYFFLEIFGSAVVEHLTTMTGARLCAWAERQGMAVLPHYSPGYPEWEIDQQPHLLELLQRGDSAAMPRKLQALESGMLRPKKSLLAVFGLTKHIERVRRLTDLIPCENCSFLPCQFRRASYVRAPELSQLESEAVPPIVTEPLPLIAPLNRHAKYGINSKALSRWAGERLTLASRNDGGIDALFRYEGTTCSNMGRPIFFDYHVALGPREQGYPIQSMRSTPAAGDTGHTFMCRYMTNAEHLMVAIDQEKPLLGQPLNDILNWQHPSDSAGCYCEPASRKHKWGLVLETIHFALVQKENQNSKQTGSTYEEKIA